MPDGLFFKSPVQPSFEKFCASRFTQINSITPPSTPKEGRIAIVTNAGLDAMDAGGAADESAFPADGEVVWSWRPDAGVKSVETIPPATVANKPGHWGEHEGNR